MTSVKRPFLLEISGSAKPVLPGASCSAQSSPMTCERPTTTTAPKTTATGTRRRRMPSTDRAQSMVLPSPSSAGLHSIVPRSLPFASASASSSAGCNQRASVPADFGEQLFREEEAAAASSSSPSLKRADHRKGADKWPSSSSSTRGSTRPASTSDRSSICSSVSSTASGATSSSCCSSSSSSSFSFSSSLSGAATPSCSSADSGLASDAPSQILPHLFVGDQAQTQMDTISNLNISYILSLQSLPKFLSEQPAAEPARVHSSSCASLSSSSSSPLNERMEPMEVDESLVVTRSQAGATGSPSRPGPLVRRRPLSQRLVRQQEAVDEEEDVWCNELGASLDGRCQPMHAHQPDSPSSCLPAELTARHTSSGHIEADIDILQGPADGSLLPSENSSKDYLVKIKPSALGLDKTPASGLRGSSQQHQPSDKLVALASNASTSCHHGLSATNVGASWPANIQLTAREEAGKRAHEECQCDCCSAHLRARDTHCDHKRAATNSLACWRACPSSSLSLSLPSSSSSSSYSSPLSPSPSSSIEPAEQGRRRTDLSEEELIHCEADSTADPNHRPTAAGCHSSSLPLAGSLKQRCNRLSSSVHRLLRGKCINISDTFEQILDKFFDETHNFIEEARRNKCNVLVHCKAGISRSPTIAIAYLMKWKRLRLQEAYNFVKRCRPQISPNLNFMGQLVNYERQLHGNNTRSQLPSPTACCIMLPLAQSLDNQVTHSDNKTAADVLDAESTSTCDNIELT